MKLLFLSVVMMISASVIYADDAETVEGAFASFKAKFNRNYTAEEEPKRFEIFQKNFKEVHEHNEKFRKGEVTWSKGINLFSDRTPEERTQYTGAIPNPNP